MCVAVENYVHIVIVHVVQLAIIMLFIVVVSNAEHVILQLLGLTPVDPSPFMLIF